MKNESWNHRTLIEQKNYFLFLSPRLRRTKELASLSFAILVRPCFGKELKSLSSIGTISLILLQSLV